MSKSDIKIEYTQLFINNEFVDAKSGKKFPTYNPATEEVIAEVHEACEEDVNLAVDAACNAFARGSEWRSLDETARGELIHKFAQLLRRDINKLAALETLNNGKPLGDAIADIDSSIKCFEYYAGWCDKICGKTIPVEGPFFAFTRHEPVGVCGMIIPWNYPINMMSWKFAPALACGNTVILKPAESTPLTALACAALFKEAGFPAGVVNIVPGYGQTGALLASHLKINKIAFTGSTVTGRKIQEASAKSNLKRVTLELGGKSPLIVFKDADIAKAADECATSIFSNQGQVCSGASRAFVHADVHDKFVEAMIKCAESKVVGDPFDEKSEMGAVINKTQFEKILKYIEVGKEEGAKCVTGGQKIGDKGYFVKPTVFTEVTDDMRIAKEEIFGPVLSVLKFKETEEVIERANSTTYGLAAGVFSRDINLIMEVTSALQAGTVWVNCYDLVHNSAPFGGFKQSGFGRELGEYGLHEYCEVKNVTIRLNQ